MKFSICIPNYNYEKYLGRTIKSVLDQTYQDFEILVSDNASTDRSVEVVREIGDPRIKLRVNACNVGFAGNLDRAARMASGDVMIMLSSDDVMRPDALRVYRDLYESARAKGELPVLCASADVIDPSDTVTDRLPPDAELYTAGDRLAGASGPPVYRLAGEELLRRCITTMRNPFNFLATAYPREVYERLEGYGGGRQINPDKWFAWRLLGAGTVAYFVDLPLFAYRWHPTNQNAQEKGSGALKYLADEYVSTFEIDRRLLERIGLDRAAVEAAFVECDIARHGLATLARGDRKKARRILDFGRATYPDQSRANAKMWALAGLLALGPVGARIATLAFRARDAERRAATS